MWLEKSPISIIIVFCLIVVYSLFYIKEEVLSMRSELQEVNKQIEKEEDSINILTAEFAYLTSPERLKKLNMEYVKLKETKLSQIATDSINWNKTSTRQLAQNNIKNTKWRYKKGPEKYITLVSMKKK